MADLKITELSAETSLLESYLLPIVEDPSGIPITKKSTFQLISDFIEWTPYRTVTPTSGTLDSPSFELVFAGVDLTTVFSVGMKIRLTQSTTKYFIITKMSFSTNTTMTLYGGTDYALVSTGTTVVSNFSVSRSRCPVGFPMDPQKWTETLTDTTSRSQSSPTQNTWYNLGSLSKVIPIGVWRVSYHVSFYSGKNNTDLNRGRVTLSTANNTESDNNFTANTQIQALGTADTLAISVQLYREKWINLTSKTTYYLNALHEEASASTLRFDNDVSPLFIRSVCAYL